MDEPTSAVSPGVIEWTLRNQRRKETRHYEQSELSIEGETRLIGIGRKVGVILGDAGYTWGQLGEFFDENQEVDWVKAAALMEHIATYAPDLIGEAATVFLGIFPTNEDGSRNESYEDEVTFLRGAVNVTRFVDMVRVFIAQNEYARLIAPFSTTLSEAMAAYGGPVGVTTAGSSAPSGPQAIVGTDGSILELEPETDSTPTDGAAQPSASDSPPKDSSTVTSTETSEPQPSASETKHAE